MNKLGYLILSGITLSISGIAILASDSIGFEASKVLIPSFIIISGVLAIFFANANTSPQSKRPIQYLLYQGVGYILFGLICAFGVENLDNFLSYVTYFILFTSLFDINFGFAVVNSDFKWTWGILIFKFLGALIGAISGVVILATSFTNQYLGLCITGIVIILMGIGTTIFATKINKIPA